MGSGSGRRCLKASVVPSEGFFIPEFRLEFGKSVFLSLDGDEFQPLAELSDSVDH